MVYPAAGGVATDRRPPARRKPSIADVAFAEEQMAHAQRVNAVPTSAKSSLFTRPPSSATGDKESSSRVSAVFLKSDIHGLPEWYEATSRRARVIWTAILLLAFTLLSVELYVATSDFVNNPILTTYSLSTDDYGLTFPKIILCPANPVHFQTWVHADVDSVWEKTYAKGLLRPFYRERKLGEILKQKATIFESLAHLFEPDVPFSIPGANPADAGDAPRPFYPKDAQDYFFSVGYPLDTFLSECAFGGQPINCSDIAEDYMDSDHGKCFLINQNAKLRQTVSGIGLSVAINLDLSNAEDPVNPPFASGVSMKVYRESDMGWQMTTFLQPGAYTKASLEATKLNLLDYTRFSSKRRCVDAATGYEELEVLRGRYSSHLCQMDCTEQAVLADCGCVLPIDARYLAANETGQKPRFCTVAEMSDCAATVIGDGERIRRCSADCKLPCTFWKFRVDTSSISLVPNGGGNGESIPWNEPPGRSVPWDEPPKINRNGNRQPPLPVLRGELPPDSSMPLIIAVEAPTGQNDNRSLSESGEADLLQSQWEELGHAPIDEKRRRKRATNELADVRSLVVLDVHYSSLHYVEISQENSMTFTTFVSNIGGQVGLWIGASIVTVVKFVYLLAPSCSKVCRRKK